MDFCVMLICITLGNKPHLIAPSGGHICRPHISLRMSCLRVTTIMKIDCNSLWGLNYYVFPLWNEAASIAMFPSTYFLGYRIKKPLDGNIANDTCGQRMRPPVASFWWWEPVTYLDQHEFLHGLHPLKQDNTGLKGTAQVLVTGIWIPHWE